MSFKRCLLLSVMGTGIMLLLVAATANVVNTDGRVALNQEQSEVPLEEVDPFAPRIVIFPPSGSFGNWP